MRRHSTRLPACVTTRGTLRPLGGVGDKFLVHGGDALEGSGVTRLEGGARGARGGLGLSTGSVRVCPTQLSIPEGGT